MAAKKSKKSSKGAKKFAWEKKPAIAKPKKSDFVTQKKKKRLVSGTHIVPARTLIQHRDLTTLEEPAAWTEPEVVPKEASVASPSFLGKDWLATGILVFAGVTYLSFIGVLIGKFIAGLGMSDVAAIEGLFYASSVISVLLSLAFCVRKNITQGFIFIAVILIVYAGLSLLISQSVFAIIGTLLILLAILPIEIYTVVTNTKEVE